MNIRIPAQLTELAEALPLTLTLAQAAECLHVTVRHVQRMIARGELAVIKSPGGRNARVLITRSELLRWLAERSR